MSYSVQQHSFHQRRLVEALHAVPRPMVVGGVANVSVALACAWFAHDGVFVVFACLFALSTAGRLATARQLIAPEQAVDVAGWMAGGMAGWMAGAGRDMAKRDGPANGAANARPHGPPNDPSHGLCGPQLCAIVQGTLAALLLGAMAFYAILFGKDTFLHVATITVALANAVGVVGRSFASPLLVRLQISALCLPVSLAVVLTGETGSLVLAGLPLALIFATIELARAQRRTFDAAIEGQVRSAELARQLSTTLETTPSGILMFDRTGRLRFANAQACTVLGIGPQDTPQRGGEGLHRAAVETRIARTLAPTDEHGLGHVAPAGQREFARRDDASRILRFAERTNAAGETAMRIDDVSALAAAERRTVRMARFDALTGLANRAWFFERVEAILVSERSEERSGERGEERSDGSVMVAVADLDGLKTLNDTHGHGVGDAAIRTFAQRLHRAAGEAGFCARLGGDEFAVFARVTSTEPAATEPAANEPAATEPSATDLAAIDRLVNALEAAAVFQLPIAGDGEGVDGQTRLDGQTHLDVRASLGVCIGDPTLGLDDLLERADFAQYEAKGSDGGAGRFRGGAGRFEGAMEARLERRKVLRADLPVAIEDGTLATVYQPIVAARENRIVAFEALARWTHPRFGAVPPDEFVALAEQAGVVGGITRVQLAAATRFCCTLPDTVGVSVNVSARDVAAGTVVADIRRALTDSGLLARRLTVEVTETSLLDLGPAVCATLEAVRAMGVHVSLDDFGTGYSSLSHMQRLHVDAVKLDRSFLATLDEGPRMRSILRAVGQLASGLGMQVVVEGVETERQLDVLAGELGFDLFQGYLFARPLSGGDARELARRMTPTSAAKAGAPSAGVAAGVAVGVVAAGGPAGAGCAVPATSRGANARPAPAGA